MWKLFSSEAKWVLKACLRGGCALQTHRGGAEASCFSYSRNMCGNFFSRKLVVQRGFLIFRRGAMAGPSLLFLPDKWWVQLPEGKYFGPLPNSGQNRHPSCIAWCPMGMGMWSNTHPGSKMSRCLSHRSQKWLLRPLSALWFSRKNYYFLYFSHIPCWVLSSLSCYR